jgi:hypothetical protein
MILSNDPGDGPEALQARDVVEHDRKDLDVSASCSQYGMAGLGSGSFLICTLIKISQTLATLKNKSMERETKISPARFEKLESSVIAQRKACVSSSTFTSRNSLQDPSAGAG